MLQPRHGDCPAGRLSWEPPLGANNRDVGVKKDSLTVVTATGTGAAPVMKK
jgi:hypothetical protein